MYTTKTIAAAAAALAFTAVGIQGAQAAPRHDGFYGHGANVAFVNMRVRNQARRIRRAYRRGRIDWVQARRARFELSHIRGFRTQYMSNGWLNVRENRHLHRLLDRNSRRIRRMVRYNWGGWRDWRNWRRIRDERRFDGRPSLNRSSLSRYDGFR